MKVSIRPHHQKGILNLIKTYENDPRYLGLIIGGSIAKGCARPDSDIDFMIIATDNEYERRRENGNFFINRTDLTDYENGFVDGKIINTAYLSEVNKKGNEPSRAAFDGAFIAFSKIKDLDKMISNIRRYPKELVAEKIRSFYSMSFIQHWLMHEAQRHNNAYTKHRAASQLTLFIGRLILAYNHIFFPYHKWFYEYLGRCPNKPEDLLQHMNAVLQEPNTKNADILFESIKNFKDWGVTDIEAFSWFMEDVELAWMRDQQCLEDW